MKPIDATTQARIAQSATIVTHSVLIGLSNLIPVPFLDDYAREVLERRLTRALLAPAGVSWSEADIRVLANGPRGSTWKRIGLWIALRPFRQMLRTLFLAWRIKGLTDVVSESYHRGYLTASALARGALDEGHNAASLRAAIDDTLATVGYSPAGAAIRSAMESATGAVTQAARSFFSRVEASAESATTRTEDGRVQVGEQEIHTAAHEAGHDPPLETIVDRIRRYVADLPASRFRTLDDTLEIKLQQHRP